MMLRRRCSSCRRALGKGERIREEVEVHGLVGEHGRDFCSRACLERHRKVTAALKATRRPRTCMGC